MSGHRSLGPDTRRRDDLRPFRDLLPDARRELLRSTVTGVDALTCELLGDVGQAQHFFELGIETLYDSYGCFGRRNDTVPQSGFVPRHARFRNRWHVGQRGRALG